MRLSLSFLLPALCWRLAIADESTAHVYTLNPDQSWGPGKSRTVSPVAARLVLAQRAGLEEFHSTDLQDSDVVDAINEYGLRTPIFSDQNGPKTKRILFLAVGDKAYSYVNDHLHGGFDVSGDPSSQSASELFHDLELQALTLPPGETTDVYSASETDNVSSFFDKVLGKPNVALTVLYVPLTPREYGAGAEWGTYSMPERYRDTQKRQAPKEEPLEVSPDTSFAPVESSTTNQLTNLASSPLPGILPACFPSESSCNDLTRNCTGHGKCSLKYTDTSSDPSKKCYSCQCSASVKEVDGKTQTTYWGGPACQKRDVSVQFWLIALFSVAMVGLISFAVGQVWSMGDEELPSVIGAGVSGPVARR